VWREIAEGVQVPLLGPGLNVQRNLRYVLSGVQDERPHALSRLVDARDTFRRPRWFIGRRRWPGQGRLAVSKFQERFRAEPSQRTEKGMLRRTPARFLSVHTCSLPRNAR
jgi:hypothetical protein